MTTPEDWYTPEQAVHFFPDTAPSTLRRQARAGGKPAIGGQPDRLAATGRPCEPVMAEQSGAQNADSLAGSTSPRVILPPIQEASRVHVRPLLDQSPRSKARTR